jgi:hypothetical protein
MAEENRGLDGRLLQALDALIESQKRTINSLERVNTRFDKVESELVKGTRNGLKLQEDLSALAAQVSAFGSEITGQVRALASRLDEVENHVDENIAETKAARIEIVGMQNEVLNALQTGLKNITDVNDLRDRPSALERRLGL